MRTLLLHASIPPSYWHHALQMATHLHNITPSKLLTQKSPVHVLYRRVPSYAYLRVFGCLCFPLFPSTTIRKLQGRSTPCVFLGYPDNHRGYKCYDLTTRKIIICRHVKFDEGIFPFFQTSPIPSTAYVFLENPHSPYIISQHNSLPSRTLAQPNSPPTQPLAQSNHVSPSSELARSQSAQQITSNSPLAQQAQPNPTSLVQSSPSSAHTLGRSTPPSPVPLASPFQPPPPSRTYTIHPPHRPVTHSQHGIVRPQTIYDPSEVHNTMVTPSPLPRNPVDAPRDSNWI